ncbi:MAG TPA: hypothetical protein PL033_08155 [Candidatus Brocadiia bacterium]|nr:hypothetical protein [Candidatus Brocadiia bacterium]
MPIETRILDAKAVTSGPKFHYFGYYDKTPWNASGRYLLSLEIGFMDRMPTPEDACGIGMVDLKDGNRWIPLAQTKAFNWQQGTMLQWLGSAPDRMIIYNDVRNGHFAAVVRDTQSGEGYDLPLPIYAVTPDGKWGVTPNFARIHRTRPGYGYCALPDPGKGDPAPADDGIRLMNLENGSNSLIITYRQIAEYQKKESMKDAEHWFNHLQFSPDGSRFIFLHRWSKKGGGWFTRLYTANRDGSGICLLADDDMTSHFDWRDPDHVLAWAQQFNIGCFYFLFKDRTREHEIIGKGTLDCDGHCSYSPDRKWILTDTYPKKNERTLILYEPATARRIDIGRFYSAPEITGPFRCDLHPRWDRSGGQVCIDSIHEGTRHIYVLDVSPITRG